MNFLVLGSGLMGRALAFDLVRSTGADRVTIADTNERALKEVASTLPEGRVRTVVLDVNDTPRVIEIMRDHACVIGAVSYRFNAGLTRAAIDAGTHYCDLGGNDAVVREQLAMTDAARHRGVTIVPDCGLAPGLGNILAARGVERFESVDTVAIRVGGLPQNPKPPLNYQTVFSLDGLLNEYSGDCAVLRDGTLTTRPAMTEIESLTFPSPFGTMEAFHTSGGASILPELLQGRVRHFDYKTIRYPGHCEKMRALLDLGFAGDAPINLGARIMTEREVFIELLRKRIPPTGGDLVLLRVSVTGTVEKRVRTLQWEFVDFQDEKNNISSMMRCTAFPTSILAQQIAAGAIHQTGVLTPEQLMPLEPLIPELLQRGIAIREEWLD